MKPAKLSTTYPLRVAAALCTALAFLVAGCGGSSGPTSPDTPVASGGSGDSGSSGTAGDTGGGGDTGDTGGTDGSGQSGTLTIRMRDDATDKICELWVHFVDLKAKPDGQPVTYLGAIDQAVDLLTLQNGKDMMLGKFGVTTGRYQFIEMHVDQDLSYVIEKDEDTGDCLSKELVQVPLQIPSEKFKIKGPPFDVTEKTIVKIHFDAPKSLKEKGGNGNGNGNGKKDKGWMLKAVVDIEDVVQETKK